MAIGIFDSGFGGLTVLKTLVRVLPEESYIYLGDSARLPYGTKSPDTIKKYLKQNLNFFKKYGVKAVVIACHSASTVYDPDESFDFPVYDMIAAGANEAFHVSKNKSIGILGTKATTKSQAYNNFFAKLSPEIKTSPVACPLFVPLVEEGIIDDPLTNLIAFRYLSKLKSSDIDTLIMACTHYPVLKKAITKVLGNDIVLIDSSIPLAEKIKHDINEGFLEKNNSDTPTLKILATDTSESFITIAQNIISPVPINSIELVDI